MEDIYPKTYTCHCGFTWEHGKSGGHNCGPYYRQQIESLRSRLEVAEREKEEALTSADKMREAIDDFLVDRNPANHGEVCQCDPDTGYYCPVCRFANDPYYKAIGDAIATTPPSALSQLRQEIYGKCEWVCEAVAAKRWPNDLGPEADECLAGIRALKAEKEMGCSTG